MTHILITDTGVQASMDNGISVVALEKGEIYDVPEFVADALIKAKRAKRPTKADLKAVIDKAEAAAGGDDADDGGEKKTGNGK